MSGSKQTDVKETIIRESTRLFLANGFHGTSVKKITEAADIGRGTLYWYFTSKDEILETIIVRFESQFLGGLIETVSASEGNFIAKYTRFHKFATEFARDNRDLALVFNAILNEVVGTNTKVEGVIKAVYEKYRRFIESMIEDGKKDGSVKAEIDPVVYAHIIIASHAGMLVQWLANGESLDVRTFVTTFRDVLLKGITEN